MRNSQTVFVGKWKEPARDTLQLSLENVLLQRPTHQYLSNLNSLLSDSRNPHGLHEGELKSFLMRVKEESEKASLTQHSKNEDHGIQSHHFMANRWGNNEKSGRLYFLGLQNH